MGAVSNCFISYYFTITYFAAIKVYIVVSGKQFQTLNKIY